ncbi:MAG: hypothetical protein PHD04_00950 [Candidatus Pacebacteria bacterium]|nr:hypothetical protein [Candidatus Paceibacterota bacterium]
MARKSTSPRISETSAKFYPSVFPSRNAGLEYTADAFPALYRHTLHDLKGSFTRGELMLMIDVFNSTALTPIMAGQQLDIQVADGIALDHLDEKWKIDGAALNAKIAGLSIFQSACLEIWANGFWYRQEQSDIVGEDFETWLAQLL